MDNRKKILDVALELFASRGYEAVGVMEIADRAGITKPTLYHYFGSKRGLLDKLLEENFAPLLQELEQTAAYDGDLPWTLEAVASLFFRFASRNEVFYRMQLSMNFSSPDSETIAAIDPYNKKIYRILEKLFTDAAKDHGNMKNRHMRYAITFLGMINNYITLALHKYAELGERSVYDAVHQFSHGIYS